MQKNKKTEELILKENLDYNMPLSDSGIANFFGIPKVTFYRWKKQKNKQKLYIFLKNHKKKDFETINKRKKFSNIKDADIAKLLQIYPQTLFFWKHNKKNKRTNWRKKLYDFLKKHTKEEIEKFVNI